jgi:uncharacterized protein YndB with AHSA1/START domain
MTETMHLRARIDAPVERVRHALTDADALQSWLAEHAEVDLPGTYAFWGRYTPDGDRPRQSPQHVDEHTVRFAWELGDETTTVEFTWEAESATSTILSLTQTHVPTWAEAVAEPGVRSVLATFWALAISHLADYATGREPIGRCDFTSSRLYECVHIAAPPQRVFESLIDPEQTRQWFAANLTIEPCVGGRVTMGEVDLSESSARVVELEPGRRLSVQWDSLVETWELEQSDGQTRLTFVQSGFDVNESPYTAWAGSLGGLGELRRFHEVPDWRPTWLQYGLPDTPDGLLATA